MEIHHGPKNLAELFDGNSQIDVPSYQRNYVWKKENLEIYLEDLFTAANQDDVHFFGPIVLLDHSSKQGEKRYSLIDGQQRVTTAVMVISILRDLIHEKKFFKDSLHGDIDLADSLHVLLFGGKHLNEPKFLASWFIRDFFKRAIQARPPRNLNVTSTGKGLQTKTEIEQTKDIRRAYRIIRQFIEDKFVELKEPKAKDLYLRLIDSLTDKFQIHSMVVKSEADAYQLFESINHLGYKLEPADLLKSLTFRKIEKEGSAKLDSAVEQWKAILDNLNGYPLSKFLRHYLLSIQKSKVQASKVFAGFQKLLNRNALAASQTLGELLEASERYARLLGTTPPAVNELEIKNIDRIAKRLNLFSDTHRVLLLSALGVTFASEIERVFRASEYLVFRLVAARENAQDIENLYQKLANKLDSASTVQDLDLIIQEMLDRALSDEDIRASVVKNMGSVGLQYDPREDLARYALTAISDEIGGGWNASATLEHLAPQKPDKGSSYWLENFENDPTLYSQAIHWWGNLTLLEGPLNSSIRNSEWSKKRKGSPFKSIDGLNKSGFFLTKAVVEFDEWNLELVRQRSDWLLDTFLRLRSREWVNSGKISHPEKSPWMPK